MRLDTLVSDEDEHILNSLMRSEATTYPNLLSRMINLYKLLHDHWKSGGTVILRSADGKREIVAKLHQ